MPGAMKAPWQWGDGMELQFHEVAKRYGAKEALRGIDLTLTPGVYGLLGPNGAGKSTLMNILTGNLRPTRGRVTLDGQDTVSMGEAFRRRLGYCPQQQALYPGFTGEQFLYYMASLQGMSREDAKERMDWALARLDLTEAAGRPIRGWSGGMKQRVMIAIALACSPELLIADEPTTALDVTIQAQVLELMKKLKQEYQTSLILITHDLGVVAKICDKVAVVYAGEIVESGTLKEIYTDKRHPYTIGLFDSLPDIENDASTLKVIQGMVPDPANLPDGCKFHPRCPYATEACQTGKIKPVKLSDSHMVRCNRFSDTEV